VNANAAMTAADSGEVPALLEAGGLSWTQPAADGGPVDPTGLSKYSALSDPDGAERLGLAVAERVRGRGANVVVIWEEPEDAVLAHIVARELGVRTVRTWNEEGLVGHAGTLPDTPRALLLADAFRDVEPLLAMKAFVEQQGGSVVAAGVLVTTGAEDEAGLELVGLQALPRESRSD